MTSTIFALATAPGRAAVAVMRLSGPATGEALDALGAGRPAARRASLRRLTSADGATLDEALVLWMPGPKSFTGEDSAELHLHGGPAIVAAVEHRLAEFGLEPAEPGAFTRRAFENGRIDLVQAEAVADLVDAETEAQRRQALDQLGGAVSRRHEAWRAELIAILAQLEAAVDFPDEELPTDLVEGVRNRLSSLANDIEAAAADRRGERIREGFRIALMGEPNVGKSSLFNAILGRSAAIVTNIPGTTRDVIEAEMVFAGRKVILADLAGLRDSEDPIEQEGVRRALAWGESADLRLRLELGPSPYADSSADLVVQTKADLSAGGARRSISVVSGQGLDELRREIEGMVIASTTSGGALAATRERHRFALLSAAANLRLATKGTVTQAELMSEDVRLAVRHIERLTGRIGSEDVLETVFSTFCIGK